jgi:hypothetical protein
MICCIESYKHVLLRIYVLLKDFLIICLSSCSFRSHEPSGDCGNLASSSNAIPSSVNPLLVIIAPAIASESNHPANQGFLPISEADWQNTVSDCGQNSIKNNNWACNKFDAWRVFMGISIE